MQTSFQRFTVFACALLCAITLAVSLHAQTKATVQSAILPDTPVGRTFGKFLVAFNTGELEKMKQFHRENGGSEDNAEQDMGAYKRTGGLSFHSVKRGSDYELEALVQAKQDGQWLSFTVNVEEAAPHGISRIGVKMAEPPSSR